jgi:hypothetical protein
MDVGLLLEIVWPSIVVLLAVACCVLFIFILRFFVAMVLRPRHVQEYNPRRSCVTVPFLLIMVGLSVFAGNPSYLKSFPSACEIGECSKAESFSTHLNREFSEFTIVTFSSNGYTDPLENLIGSLHVWAHGINIAVYDLGFSEANRKRISGFDNVVIIPFDFSKYPKHVGFMYNYAFKPLLIQDALNRFGNILSLDAGIEVRGSLHHVFSSIRTTGYFFVEASEADPLDRIHPTTVAFLNLPAPSPKERQCYAGMHGYTNGSIAAREVLAPTVDCALDPLCIDPAGSGHENHRYEQAVFSLFMRKVGIHCRYGRYYNEHIPTTLTPNVLALRQPQLFFFRRWRYPKPYAPFVFGRTDVEPEEENTGALRENGATDRKNSDNELANCLRKNEYDISKCTEATGR